MVLSVSLLLSSVSVNAGKDTAKTLSTDQAPVAELKAPNQPTQPAQGVEQKPKSWTAYLKWTNEGLWEYYLNKTFNPENKKNAEDALTGIVSTANKTIETTTQTDIKNYENKLSEALSQIPATHDLATIEKLIKYFTQATETKLEIAPNDVRQLVPESATLQNLIVVLKRLKDHYSRSHNRMLTELETQRLKIVELDKETMERLDQNLELATMLLDSKFIENKQKAE